jgi:hypothetical protein
LCDYENTNVVPFVNVPVLGQFGSYCFYAIPKNGNYSSVGEIGGTIKAV